MFHVVIILMISFKTHQNIHRKAIKTINEIVRAVEKPID